MSETDEQIRTLEDLFKAELKEPFHYKLSLTDVRNETKEIFESMRKLYTMGLVIHFGNIENQSVDIQSLTPDKIDKINTLLNNSKTPGIQKIYHKDMIKMISNFKKNPTKFKKPITPKINANQTSKS